MFCRAVVWAFLLIFGIVLNLQAKVYWLPDYLVQGATRGSTVAPTKTKPPLTCSTYGHKTATEASGLNCESTISINGVGECFVGCKEPSPCDLVNGLSCQYGCKQYFATCASECEVCYADNCHNRTDNRTDYGCTSYWSDCSSKCELGKTCTKTDCSGFTLSSAPANASYSTCTPGCGDNTPRYKITACTPGFTLKDGTCQDLGRVVLKVRAFEDGEFIDILIHGQQIYIDWGNDIEEIYNFSGFGSVSNSYIAGEDYYITITGDMQTLEFEDYSTISFVEIIELSSITLTSLYFDALCSSSAMVRGSIPDLPPNLTSGANMFKGCRFITGAIPKLPAGIKSGQSMFQGCRNLTTMTTELPVALENAQWMFDGCESLTGNIPSLPSNLQKASWMFRGCESLTGNIPSLPSNLQDAEAMFSNCAKLTGNIPQFPQTIIEASGMYVGCNRLSGIAPPKPSNLEEVNCLDIFWDAQVSNDGSWPASAF